MDWLLWLAVGLLAVGTFGLISIFGLAWWAISQDNTVSRREH